MALWGSCAELSKDPEPRRWRVQLSRRRLETRPEPSAVGGNRGAGRDQVVDQKVYFESAAAAVRHLFAEQLNSRFAQFP